MYYIHFYSSLVQDTNTVTTPSSSSTEELAILPDQPNYTEEHRKIIAQTTTDDMTHLPSSVV